jgi:hypothetical protein
VSLAWWLIAGPSMVVMGATVGSALEGLALTWRNAAYVAGVAVLLGLLPAVGLAAALP